MDDAWTAKARWVFPVEQPPLQQGTLTVRGDRIEAVEPAGRRSADFNLGNVAVLPGLVNAHAHLDLSGLRGQVPPTPDFTDWLRAVIRHRRGQSPDQVRQAIQAGLAESLAAGTTLVGDISALGASWDLLADAPLRAVVFYELLGLPRERARQAWRDFSTWLAAHPATATCRPGVSPHAPYSVRAALFRLAGCLARRGGVPVATHLAETEAERALLRQGQGPFRAFLEALGVWDRPGLVRDFDEVLQIHRPGAPVLFIHGNFLDVRDDVPPGGTFVYCPRTHAAFGHPPHPLVRSRSSGSGPHVRIALGTDSLASNPDLDVLKEVRFLSTCAPDIEGPELLRMATLAGAEALGWEQVTGSLRPGKSADLVVIPLPDEDAADPHRLLLESSFPVRRVLFRGRWQPPAPVS